MFELAGSCGFAEYGRTINDGKVAGVSKLYRKGAGCGACYQVNLQSRPLDFVTLERKTCHDT